MSEMTLGPDPNIIAQIHAQIDDLSHYDLAYLWRFGGPDCIYLRSPYCQYFKARFDTLGGMTPEMSKQIGWDI